MSADRNEEEYHLTPSGWVRGSLTVYDAVIRRVARPTGAALTAIKEGYTSSGIDPEEITWREAWRSGAVQTTRIDSLLKKYGNPLRNSSMNPNSLHFAPSRF